ncbi:hypothetical protein Tco_0972523 [Tanacetum coccineum]
MCSKKNCFWALLLLGFEVNFCCLGVFVNTAWRYFVPPSISYAAIDIREKVSTVNILFTRNYQEESFTHKEEMAPMASSDPEVKTCSKTCLNNYETLKKQYDDLLAKQLQTKFESATYKRGLDTVEAQLVNIIGENLGGGFFLVEKFFIVLKREVGIKQYEINTLKTEFEKLKQEKDAFDFKIEKFDKASKDLDQLLESQITDKSKKGLGYSAVPPPHPLIYNRPNKLDLSYSTKKNSDAPLIEEWVSDNEDEVESPVVVKKKTVFPTAAKIEFVRLTMKNQ